MASKKTRSGLSVARPSGSADGAPSRHSDGRHTAAYLASEQLVRVNFETTPERRGALKAYAARKNVSLRELGEEWIDQLLADE